MNTKRNKYYQIITFYSINDLILLSYKTEFKNEWSYYLNSTGNVFLTWRGKEPVLFILKYIFHADICIAFSQRFIYVKHES